MKAHRRPRQHPTWIKGGPGPLTPAPPHNLPSLKAVIDVSLLATQKSRMRRIWGPPYFQIYFGAPGCTQTRRADNHRLGKTRSRQHGFATQGDFHKTLWGHSKTAIQDNSSWHELNQQDPQEHRSEWQNSAGEYQKPVTQEALGGIQSYVESGVQALVKTFLLVSRATRCEMACRLVFGKMCLPSLGGRLTSRTPAIFLCLGP